MLSGDGRGAKAAPMSCIPLYGTYRRCLGAQPQRRRRGYRSKNICKGIQERDACDMSSPFSCRLMSLHAVEAPLIAHQRTAIDIYALWAIFAETAAANGLAVYNCRIKTAWTMPVTRRLRE